MFWKRRTAEHQRGGSSGNVDRLARRLLIRQRRVADQLNGLVAKLPVREVKFTLLLFCLLLSGFSGYLVISGVSAKNGNMPALTIEKAVVPKYFDKTGDASPGQAVNADTYWQMQAFKSFRDSLAIHDRRSYDSLLLASPGLMDTIRVLEEIYMNK